MTSRFVHTLTQENARSIPSYNLPSLPWHHCLPILLPNYRRSSILLTFLWWILNICKIPIRSLSHIGWRHSDHGFPCKQEWLWLYFGDLFFDIASNKCQCVIECWQTGFINQHCLTSHTSAVVLSIGSKNSTWRIGWF